MRPYALIAAVVAAMTVAPTASSAWVTSGEVYRVWLDGRRINLTASPADDVAPAVSPDGRQVAFASDRGGRCQPRGSCVDLYVVGSDGRDLRRVASALPPTIPSDGQIAWSPDGKRLTYASGSGALYVITVGRTQQLVARRSGGPSWSADGRVIALVTGHWRRKHVVVVTPGGRRVWRARGTGSGPAGRPEWSPTGRIAVILRGRSVRVYDERGRFEMAFRGRVARWSPDGERLASLAANRLEVRALSGRLLFRKTVPGMFGYGLAWADDERLVVGRETSVSSPRAVDVRTGRTSETHNGYFGLRSPDGRMSAGVDKIGRGLALVVSRLDGTGRRILAHRTPCHDLVDATVEWFPDNRSLIYDFKCQPDPRP